MRATAQILPVAVPIHPQRFVAGDAVDQFDFVRLTTVCVVFDCHLTVPYFGAHGVAFVDDFFHLLFDGGEVIWRKRFFAIKVIVPAVFDDRADGDLCIRPKFLHRARHDMRKIVADKFQRWGFVFHGVDGDGCVGVDGPCHVPMFAVHSG